MMSDKQVSPAEQTPPLEIEADVLFTDEEMRVMKQKLSIEVENEQHF